ncbi:MAG: aminomethyltransferase family protein, partial [Hyphomicrobiales bacterium]|nr:aminomethyltransferase family protein [Hyphomicrobiales bacterium]
GKVKEVWSFRRSNYFEPVGQEIRNVAENVGLQDMSPFAKAIVSGKGARQWLDSILANRIPKTRGRIALCHLLTENGGVRAEFTVYERAPDEFYLVSAGALERHDHDTLRKLLPKDGSVQIRSVTQAYGVLVLAGPRSREVLQKLTDTDLSSGAFPWLSGKAISVGPIGLHALRVNFVGELGWELHHPIASQNSLFDLIMQAGAEFGIKPFGIRAMLSMAVEKSYRLVGRELSIEYAALESGLDRFVHLNKGEFLGRDALVHWREKGFANRFVTLELEGITDTDARGSEPIHRNGEIVGRCTSGGYGWRVGKSLALAMVRPDLGECGSEFEVTILGKPHHARVIAESPYDPQNERLRG